MAHHAAGRWFKLALKETPIPLSIDGMGGSVDVWCDELSVRERFHNGSPWRRKVQIGNQVVEITLRVLKKEAIQL